MNESYHIRVGFVASKPPIMLIEVVKIFCKFFQFNCQMQKAETNEYGYYENGRWNGMIGLIENNTYDISVPEFSNTIQRFSALDFTLPVFYSRIILVTRMPILRQRSVGSFLGFKWSVWLCLILASFVISLALVTFTSHKNKSQFLWTIFDRCTTLFFMITNQYSDMPIVYLYAKFLVLFWFLFTVIINGVYSGHMVSLLLKYETTVPFSDLDTFIICVKEQRCQLATNTLSKSYIQDVLNSTTDRSGQLRHALKKNPILIESNKNVLLHTILDSGKDIFITWMMTESGYYDLVKGWTIIL